MSIKERQLSRINRRILRLQEAERLAPSRIRREGYRLRRLASMFQFEVIQNEVAIRAQSLSYFTLFSLLPLLTGMFLILGFFSQWGPVQKEFEKMLFGVLSSIPAEEQRVLMNFLLQFRDQYLENLSQKSGPLGVFAVLVLFWIGARVFFNVESLMNRIWWVRAERPLWERLRNFIVFLVILPFSYALAISVPRVLRHLGTHQVGAWMEQGLLGALVLVSLGVILKTFPNTRVSWRSAALGALAGFFGFGISNFLLGFYFRFGTQTAYGKAAALPILAFFIYVAWWIFISAVEVSLLAERGGRRLERHLPNTTLAQALILRKLVHLLQARFEIGQGPMPVDGLLRELEIGLPLLDRISHFLEKREIVVRIPGSGPRGESLALARPVPEADLGFLVQDFLDLRSLARNFDVSGLIPLIRSPEKS